MAPIGVFASATGPSGAYGREHATPAPAPPGNCSAEPVRSPQARGQPGSPLDSDQTTGAWGRWGWA